MKSGDCATGSVTFPPVPKLESSVPSVALSIASVLEVTTSVRPSPTGQIARGVPPTFVPGPTQVGSIAPAAVKRWIIGLVAVAADELRPIIVPSAGFTCSASIVDQIRLGYLTV